MENYNETSKQGNRFFDGEQIKNSIHKPNGLNIDDDFENENPTHPFREENDEIEQQEVDENVGLNRPDFDETEVDDDLDFDININDEELEDEEDFDVIEDDDPIDDSLEEN